MTTLQEIQVVLEVKPDNIWGPKSQAALNKQIALTRNANRKIEDIQILLQVDDDGQWGRKSQGALNRLINNGEFRSTTFSSFADPDDLKSFKKCKLTGKTDVQCFAVGDNGIGQFGAITSQEHTPMVAIHSDDMIAKWGSRAGAAHRLVELRYNGKVITASCEDRISARGRVDLNPACLKEFGLKPPTKVAGEWRWKL